jgi:hypothetical protein
MGQHKSFEDLVKELGATGCRIEPVAPRVSRSHVRICGFLIHRKRSVLSLAIGCVLLVAGDVAKHEFVGKGGEFFIVPVIAKLLEGEGGNVD